jgi:hypothetical protein
MKRYNIKDLKNDLALYGANIEGWQDKETATLAIKLIQNNDDAKKLHESFAELDRKLSNFKEHSNKHYNQNIESRIISHINNEINKNANSDNDRFFFIIYASKILPIIAILLVTLSVFRVYTDSENQLVKANQVASINDFIEGHYENKQSLEYLEFSINFIDNYKIDEIKKDQQYYNDIEYILNGIENNKAS